MSMNAQDKKNIQKRYLIWFYKSAKEAFDKVERKFTQAEVDLEVLARLKRFDRSGRLRKELAGFEEYIDKKLSAGKELKFAGRGTLKNEYIFLAAKLDAVEKVIAKRFGPGELSRIKRMYEQEMTSRILRSTEH
jgi:hypothetical protein